MVLGKATSESFGSQQQHNNCVRRSLVPVFRRSRRLPNASCPMRALMKATLHAARGLQKWSSQLALLCSTNAVVPKFCHCKRRRLKHSLATLGDAPAGVVRLAQHRCCSIARRGVVRKFRFASEGQEPEREEAAGGREGASEVLVGGDKTTTKWRRRQNIFQINEATKL